MSSGNLADAADAAVQSAVGSLDMPDGSSAGVVSLRRPLVERLRMTAAAMDAVAHAEVTSLAASAVFDGTDGGGGAGGAGGGGGLGGSSTPFGHALGPRSASEAASELRDLILAVQDLTAERDEAQKLLEKLRAEVSGEGGGLSELDTLREENAALRAEAVVEEEEEEAPLSPATDARREGDDDKALPAPPRPRRRSCAFPAPPPRNRPPSSDAVESVDIRLLPVGSQAPPSAEACGLRS